MPKHLSKLLIDVEKNLDKVLTEEDAKTLAYQSYRKIRNNERLREKLDRILDLYYLLKNEISEFEDPETASPGRYSSLVLFSNTVSTIVSRKYNTFSKLRYKYIDNIFETNKISISHKIQAYFIEKNISMSLLNYYSSIANEGNVIRMFRILEKQRYERRLDKVIPELSTVFSEESRRIIASGILLSQLGNKHWFTYATYLISVIENPEFSKEVYEIFKEIYNNRRNKQLVRKLMKNLEKRIPEMRDAIERTWKINMNDTSYVSILEYFILASTVIYGDNSSLLSYVLRVATHYFAYKLLKPLEGKDIVDIMLFYIFERYKISNNRKLRNGYGFGILNSLRGLFGFKFFYPTEKIVDYLRIRSEELKNLGVGEIEENQKYKIWYTYKLVIYDFKKLEKYVVTKILKKLKFENM